MLGRWTVVAVRGIAQGVTTRDLENRRNHDTIRDTNKQHQLPTLGNETPDMEYGGVADVVAWRMTIGVVRSAVTGTDGRLSSKSTFHAGCEPLRCIDSKVRERYVRH